MHSGKSLAGAEAPCFAGSHASATGSERYAQGGLLFISAKAEAQLAEKGKHGDFRMVRPSDRSFLIKHQ